MQDNIYIQGVTFRNVTIPIGVYTLANVTVVDCLFDRYEGAAILVMPFELDQTPDTRRFLPSTENNNNEEQRSLQYSGGTVVSVIEWGSLYGVFEISNCQFRNGRSLKTQKMAVIWFNSHNHLFSPDPN